MRLPGGVAHPQNYGFHHGHLDHAGRGVPRAQLLHLLVDARLAAGDLAGARACVTQLADVAQDCPQLPILGWASLSAARVAAAAGDAATAVDRCEDALLALADAGLAHDFARARLDLATVLAAERPDVARAEAGMALATFDRMGARADADEAAALLRRLGDTSRPPRPGGGALSGREREVLALLAEGLTNAQIADRLFISIRTAEHHVGNVLRKLGVANRAEAAVHAVRHPQRLPGT